MAATRAKERLTLLHSPYTDAGRPVSRIKRGNATKGTAKRVTKPGAKEQQTREPFTELSSLLDHRRVMVAAVTNTR